MIYPSVVLVAGRVARPLGKFYLHYVFLNIGPRLRCKIALEFAEPFHPAATHELITIHGEPVFRRTALLSELRDH